MNMQAMMKEAQRLQKELMKTQNELEKTEYVGSSSLVNVKINGNKQLISVTIDKDADIQKEDIEMLEDMIMIAVNDAIKKADEDKQSKLGKYGSGLSGLM